MMIPRLLRLRGSRGMYFYFNLIAWFLLIRSSAARHPDSFRRTGAAVGEWLCSPSHTLSNYILGVAVSGFSSANSTVIAEEFLPHEFFTSESTSQRIAASRGKLSFMCPKPMILMCKGALARSVRQSLKASQLLP